MILTHASCLAHDMGPAHPEAPARLRAVLHALDDARFAQIPRREAPRATREQLARCHVPELIDTVFGAAPDEGLVRLDPDTAMSPGSLDAALRAAGANVAAVDALVAGEAQRVFCAVRPPGHHATRARVMGFCLFNNAAVAAAHAIHAHGLERVAIVDFDVHHGNGTQDIFEHEPRVMYVSSHQWPLYPGTGAGTERGDGNVFNAPLAPGSGSPAFRMVYERLLLPELDRFRPQLVIASAGFDAHRLDPLASLMLDGEDYAWITRELVAIAERHAGGRMMSTLEGGYSLEALVESTQAHCSALFEPG